MDQLEHRLDDEDEEEGADHDLEIEVLVDNLDAVAVFQRVQPDLIVTMAGGFFRSSATSEVEIVARVMGIAFTADLMDAVKLMGEVACKELNRRVS